MGSKSQSATTIASVGAGVWSEKGQGGFGVASVSSCIVCKIILNNYLKVFFDFFDKVKNCLDREIFLNLFKNFITTL